MDGKSNHKKENKIIIGSNVDRFAYYFAQILVQQMVKDEYKKEDYEKHKQIENFDKVAK